VADGVDAATVEQRVERHARQLLTTRAETVARSEIMTSLNRGALAAYDEAIRGGWIDRDTARVEWIAGGPAVCDECQPLDGVQVRVGESFEPGLLGPPRHPRCVCTTALVVPTVEELQVQAAPVTPPKESEKMAAQSTHFFHATLKAIDPPARRIGFTASHPDIDRQGDSLEAAGIDLRDYLRNPILLRDHDLTKPVGVVDRLRVEMRGGAPALVGEAVIGDDDLGPHVRETWLQIQRGILRGISIGFQGLDAEPLGRDGGMRFLRSRLLEISVVSVPACASCLIERKAQTGPDDPGRRDPVVAPRGRGGDCPRGLDCRGPCGRPRADARDRGITMTMPPTRRIR
jgi:HK97 family phage prohead protease